MHHHLALCSCLLFTACVSRQPREISGRLVQAHSSTPIAGQQLHLDRPPGNYTGIPMFLVGVPQPVAIATTTTDEEGRFQFATTKDRGRFLEIRLAGRSPSDFRSRRGYAVQQLSDTLHPSSPHVRFYSHVVHAPDGGFRSLP